MTSLAVYARLVAYLKPYWWAILLVVAGFAINAGTEVSVAKLMQFIIDAINHHDRSKMNLFPALIIVLFVEIGRASCRERVSSPV